MELREFVDGIRSVEKELEVLSAQMRKMDTHVVELTAAIKESTRVIKEKSI